jgi:hypothetical protein
MTNLELLNDICFQIISYNEAIKDENLKSISDEIKAYEKIIKENINQDIIEECLKSPDKYYYLLTYYSQLNKENMNKIKI